MSTLADAFARLEEERLKGSTSEFRGTHKFPIGDLPPETLSLIFQFACPDIEFDDALCNRTTSADQSRLFHLKLGAVSRSWRYTAWSCPDLWTTAQLPVWTWETSTGVASILKLHLENSGSLPLYISLCFKEHSNSRSSPLLVHECVDALLHQDAHRLTRLRLNNPAAAWAGYIFRLPRLREVSLVSLSPMEQFHLAVSSNRFHRLTVAGCIRDDNLQLTLHTSQQITSLILCHVPKELCESLLSSCPSLVDLRCHGVERGWMHNALNFPVEPIVLHHLSTLNWEACHVPYSGDDLLEQLRVPDIRTLRWDEENCHRAYIPTQAFANFSRCLPSTLTTIEFHRVLYPRDCSMGFIRPDAVVEHLVFSSCSDAFIQNVLQELIPKPHLSIVMLPRFRQITITGVLKRLLMPVELKPSVTESFVEMLEGRCASGMSSGFRLEDSALQMRWTDPILKRIKCLTRTKPSFDFCVQSELVGRLCDGNNRDVQ